MKVKTSNNQEMRIIEKASRFTCLYFIIALFGLMFYRSMEGDERRIEMVILLIGFLLFSYLRSFYKKKSENE